MEEAKLKMVIEGENRADKAIKEAENQVNTLQKRVKDMSPTFKTMATTGTATFGAIAGVIGLSIKQATEMESVQDRLYQLLKTTNGATKEQVDVLIDQANALERAGVMSKDNIIMAQSQLATFDLQTDTIKELTPAIMDYVVAEKGMNATTEDVKALTNGLAQALQGNFSSLTRVGFVLDDNTKKMISEGTEKERAIALTEVLNSTYKDFNITAKDTAEGGLVVLQRSLGDIAEEIGATFIPILKDLIEKITPVVEKVVDWIKENPELTRNMIIVAGAVAGLVAVVGALGLALPGIITAFTFLSGPIGIVIAALVALGAAVVMIKNNWKKALETIQIITETFVMKIETFFLNLKLKIIEIVDGIKEKIQPVIDMVSGISSSVSGAVSGVFGKAKNFLLGSRETGGYIPQTGPYLLHQGEYVLPKGDSGMNITFNFNGDVNDRDTLMNEIIKMLNRAGIENGL